MKFLKWFLAESLFHIILLTIMFIMTLFWEPADDRTIARIAIALIFAVLIIGKYRYFCKIQRFL